MTSGPSALEKQAALGNPPSASAALSLSKACWSNPNIAGVVLRTTWGKIESAQNQYDWTYLDTGVALAQAHNKKVSISVRAGVDSPSWVYCARR